MFRFFRNLMTKSNKSSKPVAPQFRPAVEAMEDRLVLSATNVLHKLAHHHKPHHKPHHLVTIQRLPQIPPVKIIINVPDFTGDYFVMHSPSTNHDYDVLIQSETFNANGSANITGLWGKQNNGGVALTGQLAYDSVGVHITFAWANNTHSFDGDITGSAAPYAISGTVTVQGGGGPGFMAGQQNLVPNLAGLTFHMTSQDNQTTHTLAIQTETFFANGTASFTGVWDGGATISFGALNQDALGTHITFAWGNNTHSFDGHVTFGISFSTGGVFRIPLIGYSIDGQVTVQGGGGPGHVTGFASTLPVLLLENA